MEPYSPHAYPAQPDRYPPAPEPLNRYTGRTPSPTPSEVEALTSNILNVKRYLNWRFWARKEWIGWYILFAVILVVSILIGVYDKQIVHWLTPAGNWMKKLPAGWLIPIAILFIISFPPLFGHEIVAILVGVIWGLGLGFAIVAAGTFIGEIGNYYAFKYCCRARGEKMERDGISYACLARVVREGGFKVALVIRLSVIPGHFSTAVFSTCGMGVVVFALAAFFSLPKQLVTVYIGVVLQEGGSGTTTSKDTIISDLVLVFTTLLTFVAGYYIYYLINNVKPAVIYERRKARQVKIAGPTYAFDNTSVATLYPTADSDVDLPSALYHRASRSRRPEGISAGITRGTAGIQWPMMRTRTRKGSQLWGGRQAGQRLRICVEQGGEQEGERARKRGREYVRNMRRGARRAELQLWGHSLRCHLRYNRRRRHRKFHHRS
ncbi:hypothetical protein JB92DRAFT_464148 [Gautieria morchelliformis]|nr:hypothetical protein JB92DRAFT_464148 [Gautieria morchelliformis]